MYHNNFLSLFQVGVYIRKKAPLAVDTAPTTPSSLGPETTSDSWDSEKVSLQLLPQNLELQSNEISKSIPKCSKKKKISKTDKSTKESDASELSDKKSTKTDKQTSTEKDNQMSKETERKLGPKFSFRLFRMNGIFSGPNKEKKSGNFTS